MLSGLFAKLKHIAEVVSAIQAVIMFTLTISVLCITIYKVLQGESNAGDVTRGYVTKLNIPGMDELTAAHSRDECKLNPKDSKCIKYKEIPCKK
jgi:hypothetical protein